MTKLTREIARKQAARLQSNPMLAPQSDDGRREIVDLLLRNCQSGEHAEAVMTAFLERARKVENVTAEIATIARATATAEQAPAGCERCYLGPDVSTGEVRYAAHVSRIVGGYDVATRCDGIGGIGCPRGQWLSARDRERRTVEAAKVASDERRRATPERADFARLAAGDGPEEAV